MSQKYITEGQKEEIIKSMRRHGAVVGYLFGSYARGTAGPLSDIDVAVIFPTDMAHEVQSDQIEEIREDLERMFGRDKADVVNVYMLKNPLLKFVITLGQGILLFSDNNVLKNQINQYARREYEDTKFLRAIQYKTLQTIFN